MRALIIVDLQNDFVPGGALAVPEGNAVVPVANRVQEKFELIVATQDWHPPDHGSFAANHPGKKVGDVIQLDGLEQILWPVHCVQNTPGAAFVPEFNTARIQRIFYKGIDPRVDSYSCLFDNAHRRSTGLSEFLKDRRVGELYIMGLATDYCVKFSALDARGLGFETCVIADGCRGVNLKPHDSHAAIEEMQRAGVKVIQSDAIS